MHPEQRRDDRDRAHRPPPTRASILHLPVRNKHCNNPRALQRPANPNNIPLGNPNNIPTGALAFRPKPTATANLPFPTGSRKHHQSHNTPLPNPNSIPIPPVHRQRPKIAPKMLWQVQQTLHATRALVPDLPNAAEIDALIHPPFDPLFDQVHPGNPAYVTGRVCPCPCTVETESLQLDSQTGEPSRNLSADVTKTYGCGHKHTYSTRCDIFYHAPDCLAEIEFPHLTPEERAQHPLASAEYAPHRPPHILILEDRDPCTACTGRGIAHPHRHELYATRRDLKNAKRLGWSRERCEQARAKVRALEYDVAFGIAIAEALGENAVAAEREAREREQREAVERELVWCMKWKGGVR